MIVPFEVIEAATLATILNRQIKELTAKLDECKAVIRPWAIEQAGGKLDMIEIATEGEGLCTVVFPKPVASVVEGESLDKLFTNLDPHTGHFDLILTLIENRIHFDVSILGVEGLN